MARRREGRGGSAGFGARHWQMRLTARHLDRLDVELLTGGGRRGGHLSQKTVARTHAVLPKALADAVESDLAAGPRGADEGGE